MNTDLDLSSRLSIAVVLGAITGAMLVQFAISIFRITRPPSRPDDEGTNP